MFKGNKIDGILVKLRELVGKDNLIEVGKANAKVFDVAESTFARAVKYLTDHEGYKAFYIPVKQKSTDRVTSIKVLTVSSANFLDIMNRKSEIRSVSEAIYEPKPKHPKRSKEEVERMVFDMRQLKRKGMSNVAIAEKFGLNESTVRRHLAKPLTTMESMINTMIRAVESGQDHILKEVTSSQDFLKLFGVDYGPGYYLRVHDTDIHVVVEEGATDKSFKQMRFNISFIADKVADNR